MSHFTVMVIGDNPEEQLAPFHEFECTGVDDQYIQNVDETEDVLSSYENYKEEYPTVLDYVKDYHGREVVPFGEEPDVEGDHKYGYVSLNEDGTVNKVIERTNPNYKWDWYVLGGRWSGAIIKLKQGKIGQVGKSRAFNNETGVDQARKGDIDFEGIIRDAKKEAAEQYNDLASKCGGSIPHIDFTWASMWQEESEHFNLSRDEKTEKYYAQEGTQIWKKAVTNPFGPEIADFQCTVEEYAQKCADKAFTTHAIVKDSIWYEKGSMGWFAMVSDAKEQADWNNEVSKLLEGLPDDTLISIYDCHI